MPMWQAPAPFSAALRTAAKNASGMGTNEEKICFTAVRFFN